MNDMPISGGVDRFGLMHGTGNATAFAAFADATEGLAAYSRHTMPAIDRALAAAPDMVAARATKGLMLVLAARAETVAAARDLWRDLPSGGTSDEAALTEALGESLRHGMCAGAAALDRHLARRPDLLLLVKLSTMLRFVGGDAAGMRATTQAVLPAWSPALPGYGYVLGCHAFGLEESGDFAAAERAGRDAAALAPNDVWAVHAVAHVHEMTHRPAGGIAWIESQRPGWHETNSFTFHLAWHLALMHLDQGDADRVLELYDREIRPDRSEDTRDYTNAVALLWRLRQHGADVGDRWAELAEIAHRRRAETTLMFAALHRLLALVAVGDAEGARDVAAAIEAAGADAGDEQQCVAATIGAGLARAMLAPSAGLAAIAARLPPLGGSHAQRDLFVRTLALHASARDDHAAVSDLLALRRRLKQDDRFVSLLSGAR